MGSWLDFSIHHFRSELQRLGLQTGGTSTPGYARLLRAHLHSLWDSGGGYLTDSLSRPFSSASQTTLNNKVAAIEADYPYTPNFGAIPNPMDRARERQRIAETVSYVGITLK